MTRQIELWVAAVVGIAIVVAVPYLVGDFYQLHLATLIAVYWVLIGGLNLVVGFTGTLSIGHVGLLAVGAYCFAILAGSHGLDPFLTLFLCGALGALIGVLLGLPSLRLPGFYFAMVTLAFALIVTELSVAEQWLTGGGIGLSVPGFPGPLATPWGYYWFTAALAVAVTWMTWNVTRLMWGRALVAVRDSEVAAQSVGVSIYRAKLTAFTFSGFTAGVAGALFASLQSYITPDTFIFELGLFFFVCIIIGGRGSIVGPLLGTVVLTALPEVVAPLANLGNFFYGALLLVVVLLLPEGISNLVIVIRNRMKPAVNVNAPVKPDLARLAAAVRRAEGEAEAHPAYEAREVHA
ncbi:branched-chain amino acid ABC transporter permease [Acuticoccus sediminis]|uniref:Branched-chain amino acid ABC transporter permease n=1 Tax=Acuticoccus sediminis TaxID=2184697 RepID=A0A8B2NPQ5_9HYPH|nr:branched-chain amino acid ABC transporter permease [Acuticoccus sediminis]RAH99172.1 branched-chain amino acid ABC transporter permease [Acuticoccus sediminis]